jgi:hypothetical protein
VGGWQRFYNDTLQRMQQATSPELQAHFKAELQVIGPTLAALGISTNNGSNNPPAPTGNPPAPTGNPPPPDNTSGSNGGTNNPPPPDKNGGSNGGTNNPLPPDTGGLIKDPNTAKPTPANPNQQTSAPDPNAQNAQNAQQTSAANGNPPVSNGTVNTGGFDSSMPSGAYSSQQTADMAKQVAHKLMADFGFTKEQAAGILGNLMLESGGMNPHVNEMPPGSPGMYGPPAPGPMGYGWGQWSTERKTQFLDFAKQNNLQVGSPAANYAFLVHELKTTQAPIVDAVKAAKTVQDAEHAFLKFESPTDPHEDSRVTYANQIYAMLS